MINIIKSDLYKLRKSTAMKVLFGITLFCSIIMAVMARMIADGNLSTNYGGIGFLFSDANVTSIVGAIIAATFISGDFDNKVISTEISSGSSRLSVVFGKIVSYLISVFIVILPYAVVTFIGIISGKEYNMGQVGVGFLNLLQSASSTLLSSSDIFKLILIVFSLLVVYLGQFILCALIAFKLKKPVLVVAVYYGLTIIAAQLSNLAGKVDAFNDIYSFTPFGSKYLFMTLDSSSSDIIKGLVVSVIFIGIVSFITYFLFRKQEIK